MMTMSDDDAREALARLIEERREDFAGLSRLLGRNSAYIQQYIRRGTPRRLQEEDRRRLARYFGVSEARLGGPHEPVGASGGLVPIARYRVSASAGGGALDIADDAAAGLGFSSEFLERITTTRPRDLAMIRVEGDSMEPTLSDGDDILIDRSAALRRIHDGIHVLRHDDTLLAKRLTVSPVSGLVTIASDNPAYASWPDCDPAEIAIIGRVIWAARKIR